MFYQQLKDADIYYQEKGQGQPLVLVHGTGFNSHCWSKIVDPLAENFRVITYDRRNYGSSKGTPTQAKNHYATQGRDLIEFLEARNLEKVTLFGWSAGGLVSYHALLRDSSRVKQLICYEPPLHAVKHINWYLLRHFLKINFKKQFVSAQSGALAFTEMVARWQNGGSSLQSFRSTFETVYAKDSDTTLAEFSAGTGEELKIGHLQSIKVPITFMTGMLSVNVFQNASKRQIDLFNAKNFPIRGCGHFGQMENPDEFVSTLLRIAIER